MASPSSPELSAWDADNYDMLMKSMSHPMSPPQTSDSECEGASPISEAPSTPIVDDKKDGETKKPTKKRKSWGQELPTPTTNLPPRKRAKTEAEKEQRRIERVLRNRAAAHSSRERKRAEQEALEKRKKEIESENEEMKSRLARFESEYSELTKKYKELEHNYLLAKSYLPANSGFVPQSIPEDKTITSTSISMSDVQAMSPESLTHTPAVKPEDLTDLALTAPVLSQTQHHAVSAEQQDGNGDLVSSAAFGGDWADWTLFDQDMTLSSEFVNLNSDTLSQSSTACDNDSLPLQGLAGFELGFELFGDEAKKIDLGFLEQIDESAVDAIPDL